MLGETPVVLAEGFGRLGTDLAAGVEALVVAVEGFGVALEGFEVVVIGIGTVHGLLVSEV